MLSMTQKTLSLDWTNKRTRKREFLDEMERVVPWAALVPSIEPHSPPPGEDRAAAVSRRDDAAHPLHAELVHLQ
jgi:hypothetical protein